MRSVPLVLILLSLLLFSPITAPAQWPTTIEENLAVAVSDTPETYPYAFPYPDESTLIAFVKGLVGGVYQIIDRYGYLLYPEPQSLWPAVTSNNYVEEFTAYPDEEGGVVACWMALTLPYEQGIYAQRIDSLGNICWGDSASRIYPVTEHEFDICSDGNGGFYFAIVYELSPLEPKYVWIQHIDAMGQPTWGDSGVVMCPFPTGQRRPEITPDDMGGFYIIWEDFRSPYIPYGALFMQRFDSDGNPMWLPQTGRFICEEVWFHQIIPDGEGGFLLHTNPDALVINTVYRIAPDGNILWSQEEVSRDYRAKMVHGEPGFFYLGFAWYDYLLGDGIYGQRMDIEGNVYWPTGNLIGAPLATQVNCGAAWGHNYAYRYPYFYGVYVCHHPPNNQPFYLLAQSLDSLGNRRYGDDGSILTYINEGDYMCLNVVPDDQGGAGSVWQSYYAHDIWAKHVNADGTLGGPAWAQPSAENPLIDFNLTLFQGQIRYSLPRAGEVKLELFNLLGQRIGLLRQGFQPAGTYAARFDDQNLASGIYLVGLSTPWGKQAVKMVVVR